MFFVFKFHKYIVENGGIFMQVSLNTYKPYTTQYSNVQTQKQKQNQPTFKSGGWSEFYEIDYRDDTSLTELEKWKGLGSACKTLTVEAFRAIFDLPPKEKKRPPLLLSPEEFKEYRDKYYEGTDFEGLSPEEYLPPEPPEKVMHFDDYPSIDLFCDD